MPDCCKNRVFTLLVHPFEEIILCVCVYIHACIICITYVLVPRDARRESKMLQGRAACSFPAARLTLT